MLQINGKTFMNLQEAVQWLLDNNALPFQSSANYVANTEIGMGTIVNPSPAKVRIGSLIFFADSKVSTVIGLTENGFICSDQYNDLVDDVVYVSNVALNASGHLIVTLSNGDTIDAGLIKQVSNFSINGSQHLIANYNDGTSTDLGAIFSGNVNIAGNFTADSIIENMSGYAIDPSYPIPTNLTPVYISPCKNGNKITFVLFFEYKKTANYLQYLCGITIPSSVGQRLYPSRVGAQDNVLDFRKVQVIAKESADIKEIPVRCVKNGDTTLIFYIDPTGISMDPDTVYIVRYEVTFLLSDNLVNP